MFLEMASSAASEFYSVISVSSMVNYFQRRDSLADSRAVYGSFHRRWY